MEGKIMRIYKKQELERIRNYEPCQASNLIPFFFQIWNGKK